MFIVFFSGLEEGSVSSAWDFPTREKAEEFVCLFNAQCSRLAPDVDLSKKYSLSVSEVADEPASSFEEMFAIWQSKTDPEWLGVVADGAASTPSGEESPASAGPVLSLYDQLVESLESE